MAAKPFVFRFADMEVREREFSLTKAGEALAVEPKAFRVLLILLRNPGKLIPKQELLDSVWGDAAVTENSLSRAIALLRKVLGDEARTPRFIETVATVGYRFLGKVEAVEDPGAVATQVDRAAVGPAPSGASAEPEKKAAARRWNRVAVTGTAALAVLGGGFWYLSRPLPPPRITAYTQITHDGRSKILGGTDGSRVYFTQSSPLTIQQVGVNGGDATPVPLTVSAPEIQLADVSRDGSSALVWTNEQSQINSAWWIASLLGGSARRLVDGENCAFSPDGLSMIYVTPQRDIFLARIDGTGGRKLAQSMGGAYSYPERRALGDGFRWLRAPSLAPRLEGGRQSGLGSVEP
jgi:DNA-binding winged helix-turn-helix (wHTH) protein